MRFYLDETRRPRSAAVGRAIGLDIATSGELGRNEMTDERQLELAGRDGCCLVTRDHSDFERLTRIFLTDGRPHAGVVIVPYSLPDRYYSAIAEACAHLHEQYPDGLASYTVIWLRPPPRSPATSSRSSHNPSERSRYDRSAIASRRARDHPRELGSARAA